MDETTDNINEVISTGGNFALLAEAIEYLKKKRKKDENNENLNIDDDMVKRKRTPKVKGAF
ncbi:MULTISPECIES: hypothetical protein [Romboutsia]|jgi:hypothetical protein|uniref:hypothetical protein n=1 Tax=Romboutsia TaxID=1501226 RepID=UPI00216B6B72|nr:MULTISPECIES: hypothetical protein [Romboutsia]MCI9060828.1 hypothetical protein [Romboutsia sp.]MCI9259701.1 hypothetical protein [Romboutsia sp.]